MRVRQFVLALFSLATGVVLVAIFVSQSHIRFHETVQQLLSINYLAFTKLGLLIGLNTFLSAHKWRLMDAIVRRPEDAALSRATSFVVTSIGMAIGQILPLSISMVLARTLGMYDRNRAFARGTMGTVFDQGFDFLIVCVLIGASVSTQFLKGGAAMWTTMAAAAALATFVTLGITVGWLRRIALFLSTSRIIPSARLKLAFAELRYSGLLDVPLARKLLLLSTMRFVVLVLMAGETTEAIGAHIPLWHLAAAMPFVVISNALSITPGGLGINEITFATALTFFGTPLALGAQWALANRFLVTAASLLVAISAFVFLLVIKGRRFQQRRITSRGMTGS